MVWEQAKTALKERLGEAVFNLWIAPLECVSSDIDQITLKIKPMLNSQAVSIIGPFLLSR